MTAETGVNALGLISCKARVPEEAHVTIIDRNRRPRLNSIYAYSIKWGRVKEAAVGILGYKQQSDSQSRSAS
jgi:hypothetical protein